MRGCDRFRVVATRKLGRNHFLTEQRGQKEIRPPDFSRSRCEKFIWNDFRPYRLDPPAKQKFENRLLGADDSSFWSFQEVEFDSIAGGRAVDSKS